MIKKIPLNELEKEERVRAKNESRILEALNHPNIIKAKEVFRDKKFFMNMVMEYADDGELRQKIEERKRQQHHFTEDEVLNMFTQLCMGVKHCHEKKIMHRDLKPENIFMTERGIVKIGDFGISRFLNGTKSKAKTIAGTPGYLCPEIFKQTPYAFKSDVWSLGIILYELCMLKIPWDNPNIVQLGLDICST